MKICLFGLGYVGVVSAAILADQGHDVIGIDINQKKVDMINKGISPIIEKDVPELVKKVTKSKKLTATTDSREAVLMSEVSVVCVGTPSKEDGSANLDFIKRVMNELQMVLRDKTENHLVVLRSTVPPGTMEKLVIPIFKGLDHVSFCYNPEFLREGSSIEDYYSPPYTILACSDKKAMKIMKEYYKPVKAETHEVNFRVAETIKFINNVFHAYKITFANEVKRLCESYDIDPYKVMDLVTRDKKQNISPMYLKPGFAYGGSCLPKDLRSTQFLARKNGLKLPLIENISISNEEHIQNAIKKIESFKKKNIGFIGLSFKPGTDDLRESPYVRIIEHFIGKGYKIKVYDPIINHKNLIGANKEFIENQIPHISKILCDKLDDVLRCDIVVQNHNIKDPIKKVDVDLR